MNHLEKLRQKPEAVRVAYAVFVSGGVTGLLFLVWMVTLPTRFGNLAAPAAATSVSASETSGTAPFEALKKSLSEGYDGLREIFTRTKPAETKPAEENPVAETRTGSDESVSNGVIIIDSNGTEGLY